MVSSASRSLVPPHMNPPIAHVPNPIRETSRFKPFTVTYSMVLQPPNHCFNGRISSYVPKTTTKIPPIPTFRSKAHHFSRQPLQNAPSNVQFGAATIPLRPCIVTLEFDLGLKQVLVLSACKFN